MRNFKIILCLLIAGSILANYAMPTKIVATNPDPVLLNVASVSGGPTWPATIVPASVSGGPTWPNANGSFLPGKTIDNNTNTYWAGDPTKTEWSLIYDLGSAQNIDDIVIQFYPRTLKKVTYIPQQITVLTSADNSTFNVVSTTTDASVDKQKLAATSRARYLRIDMKGRSSAPSNRQPAIQEVYFTVENQNYIPFKTIDGTTSTYWAGDYNNNEWNLTYDLGSVQYLDNIVMQFYPRTLKRSITYVPQQITLQTSADNIAFKEVSNTTNTTDDRQQFTVYNKARYLRINMKGKSPAPSNRQPALNEVYIYGGNEPAAVVTGINYTSSYDNINLKAQLSYLDTGRKKPIVVVMHGWAGGMSSVSPTASWISQSGFFAVNIAMRGRDNSQGSPDAGRLEIHDIYDAVTYVLDHYPDEIDSTKIALWGFSGGGGNAFSAATKMPDMFNQVASFFGMNDYAYWRTNGAGDARAAVVDQWTGGTPEAVPTHYEASRSLSGVQNNPWGEIHLFWDEEEIVCPAYFDQQWLDQSQALGYTNSIPHLSLISDLHRWIHGYPVPSNTDNSLVWAMENILAKRITNGSVPATIEVPNQGAPTFRVLGYLLTRKFRVYLGDAVSSVADLNYSDDGKQLIFAFSNPVAENPSASAKIIIPLNNSHTAQNIESVTGADYVVEGNNLILSGADLNGTVTVTFN